MRFAKRFLIALLSFALLVGLAPLPGIPAPQDQLAAAVDAYVHSDFSGARALLQPLQLEPAPTGGRAVYLLGIVNLQLRRFEEASAEFNLAARTLPILEGHARFYQALAVYSSGDTVTAAQMFQNFLSRYPTNALFGVGLFWRAESLAAAQSTDAPDVFRQYLAGFGDGVHAPQAWYDLGQVLEQQGKWPDAVQAYRRVVWGFASSPFADLARVRISSLAGLHALPSDATPPDVFYKWAVAEIGALHFSAARAMLQRILTMPDSAKVADDTLFTLGTLARRTRRYDEAVRWFNQDAKLGGDHADEALLNLEGIALIFGRETTALQIAHQIGHDFPHSWRAPRALYAVAETQQDRGATGSALALYREAADQFPGTQWGDQALWAVGWMQYRAGLYDTARATWLQLTARAPDADAAPAGLYWAARVAAARGQPDQAAEEYRRLATRYGDTYYGQRAAARLGVSARVALDPVSDAPVGNVPAVERFRELDALGQTEDATRELEIAAKVVSPPDQAMVDLSLSQHYAQENDYARSITAAQEAIAAAGGPRHGLPLALWQALYPLVYWPAISQAASRVGIDPYLVAAVIREESRFDPHAGSPAGAYGLMQLILPTARTTARGLGLPRPTLETLGDPVVNITLGSAALRGELERFGREDMGLAAYNAGPVIVRHWQNQRSALDPEAFIEEIPYAETRFYVKTVLQSAGMYRWLYRDGHPAAQ
jgi:peptidoglycan lytic transglycosylase